MADSSEQVASSHGGASEGRAFASGGDAQVLAKHYSVSGHNQMVVQGENNHGHLHLTVNPAIIQLLPASNSQTPVLSDLLSLFRNVPQQFFHVAGAGRSEDIDDNKPSGDRSTAAATGRSGAEVVGSVVVARIYVHPLIASRFDETRGEILATLREELGAASGSVRVLKVEECHHCMAAIQYSCVQGSSVKAMQEDHTLIKIIFSHTLSEFQERKGEVVRVMASLLGTSSAKIHFIWMQPDNSVATIVAIPCIAFFQLFELAIRHPPVLASLGIVRLCPFLQPFSFEVRKQASPLFKVKEIVANVTIRDWLYNANKLSSESFLKLSSYPAASSADHELQQHEIKKIVGDQLIESEWQSAMKAVESAEEDWTRFLDQSYESLAPGWPRPAVAFFNSVSSSMEDTKLLVQQKLVKFTGFGEEKISVLSATLTPHPLHSISGLHVATFLYHTAFAQPTQAGVVELLHFDISLLGRQAECVSEAAVLLFAGITKSACDDFVVEHVTASGSSLRMLISFPSATASGFFSVLRDADGTGESVLHRFGVREVSRLHDKKTLSIRNPDGRDPPNLLPCDSQAERLADLLDEVLRRRQLLAIYRFPSTDNRARFLVNNISTSDIDTINIAIVGPLGSGKSSLINSILSSLSGTSVQTCPVHDRKSQSEVPGTRSVGIYNASRNIRLWDTPGLAKHSSKPECERDAKFLVNGVMAGRLHLLDDKAVDVVAMESERKKNVLERSEAALLRQAHAVVIVVDAREAEEMAEHTPMDTSPLYEVMRGKLSRLLLRFRGMDPVCVVTHAGLLSQEQRNKMVSDMVFRTRCMSGMCFFVESNTRNEMPSLASQVELFTMMSRAVQNAEAFILRRKQNKLTESMASRGPVTESTDIRTALNLLQKRYHFLPSRLENISNQLANLGFHNLRGMHSGWSQAKEAFHEDNVILDQLEKLMKSQTVL